MVLHLGPRARLQPGESATVRTTIAILAPRHTLVTGRMMGRTVNRIQALNDLANRLNRLRRE